MLDDLITELGPTRAAKACDYDAGDGAVAAGAGASARPPRPLGTPLHLAARLDLPEAAKMLVERGGASLTRASTTSGESASVDRALARATAAAGRLSAAYLPPCENAPTANYKRGPAPEFAVISRPARGSCGGSCARDRS